MTISHCIVIDYIDWGDQGTYPNLVRLYVAIPNIKFNVSLIKISQEEPDQDNIYTLCVSRRILNTFN